MDKFNRFFLLFLLTITVISILFLPVKYGNACSPDIPILTIEWPQEGEENIPLNGRILIDTAGLSIDSFSLVSEKKQTVEGILEEDPWLPYFYFKPNSLLDPYTSYTFTITTSITTYNLSNYPITNSISFTTGDQEDTEAPQISGLMLEKIYSYPEMEEVLGQCEYYSKKHILHFNSDQEGVITDVSSGIYLLYYESDNNGIFNWEYPSVRTPSETTFKVAPDNYQTYFISVAAMDSSGNISCFQYLNFETQEVNSEQEKTVNQSFTPTEECYPSSSFLMNEASNVNSPSSGCALQKEEAKISLNFIFYLLILISVIGFRRKIAILQKNSIE